MRVRRYAPARLSLGSEGLVTLEVENMLSRRVRVRLHDAVSPELQRLGADIVELELGPHARERVHYHVLAERRGSATLGDVHFRVQGPLGLVWRQESSTARDVLQVQPGILEVRRFRLLGLRHRLREAGLRITRQRGDAGAFESLREYARGDDPRTIEWKASARRGGLIVRQYEVERSQNVLLALDAGRLMTERLGDRERADHALSAALLLADVAAAHGDRVGVLSFAEHVQQYLPPSRAALSRIADALARVDPRLVEPNYPEAFGFLAHQLRRRSLVVLFTDVIDARASSALLAHLARSATRHLPLVVAIRNPDLDGAALAPAGEEAEVYRRAAAEELLQARAHALAAMQRTGVLVADVLPSDAITGVVNRYLDVKRRGLL